MLPQTNLSLKEATILYTGTFAVFLIIDFAWLSFANAAIYKPALGHLMAEKPNFVAAFIFYMMYVAGVLYLAVLPASDLGRAGLKGSVLGLIAYGTYDMTSLAVFYDWPLYVTILDMIWGTALTCLVASAGFFIKSRLTAKASA